MSRSPIFAALSRALALAAAAQRLGAPPLDELTDPAWLSRRRVLGAAAALAAAPRLAQAQIPSLLARREARIAIIGGGLAGLVAAHRLVEAGAANVTLYEANIRAGGRVLSARGLLGEGLVSELGGSFINAEHGDMLNLAREFSLALEDGAAPGGPDLRGRFFFEGSARSLADIAAAATPFMARLQTMRASNEAAKAALDRASAAALLDRLGVTGWVRKLLDIGLTQEMGLAPDRMSGLYLVETFAPDPRRPQAGLFSSDQRYQIAGGNDALPVAIAVRLGDRIRLGHRFVSLRRQGSAYAATFESAGAPVSVTADIVILALPTTMLRQAELAIDAPPLTRRAIRELTYGTNAKLFAGLDRRPWRDQGASGECLSDLGMQTVWEDHAKPGNGPGGMTIFAGGDTGIGFGQGRAADRAKFATNAIDVALPGAASAFNGRAGRMDWPSNPYVGGSYSCFAPGQWMGFSEAFNTVGRVIFAGEHTSEEHSGYMDGAAESGRRAAERAVALLR